MGRPSGKSKTNDGGDDASNRRTITASHRPPDVTMSGCQLSGHDMGGSQPPCSSMGNCQLLGHVMGGWPSTAWARQGQRPAVVHGRLPAARLLNGRLLVARSQYGRWPTATPFMDECQLPVSFMDDCQPPGHTVGSCQSPGPFMQQPGPTTDACQAPNVEITSTYFQSRACRASPDFVKPIMKKAKLPEIDSCEFNEDFSIRNIVRP